MTLRYMGCQQRELHHRLEDTKRLQFYAKAVTSEHRALEDSLGKAQFWSRHWEWKAKEGFEKMVGAKKKKREEATEKAQVARLASVAEGDGREKLEGDLARVKDALVVVEEAKAIAEEARRKAESKAAQLEVKKTSLLLELGTVKDEVSFLQSQAGKDKEAMEEEYQKALEVIFSNGYECCVFKHNICGVRPEVP